MVSMSTSVSGKAMEGEESFASLFEESLKREELKEGDIVKRTSRIISVPVMGSPPSATATPALKSRRRMPP